MEQKTDIATRLNDAGLRSTAPRRAVLETLEAGGHLEAAEVFERVVKDLPGTSLQAVYIVLTALTEAGLVRKVAPAGASAHFEARVGDNHHHLVCSQCGRIEDVPCIVGHAPCLTPSDSMGFVIDTAEVTFNGVCSDCQAKN